jgi:hypothetical protein
MVVVLLLAKRGLRLHIGLRFFEFIRARLLLRLTVGCWVKVQLLLTCLQIAPIQLSSGFKDISLVHANGFTRGLVGESGSLVRLNIVW